MDPKASSVAVRRPLPAAWTVALWLSGTTAIFLALIWWQRPSVLTTLVQELGRRVLGLGGAAPIDFFVLLGAVLALDAVVLGWRRSALSHLAQASRSARTDLLLAGLHEVGWSPLVMTFFSAGWMYLIEQFAKQYQSLDLVGSLGPAWAQFIVVLVVTDFFDYWTHRISHDVDFLWETHKYHHSATHLSVLTGTREHALNEVFRHLVIVFPLAALGVPIKQYIAVRLFMYFIDLLQHSMVPWTYGWAGRWLVFSPVGHRIHHSPRPDQHTSNYGNILVIWDRLFGTWYDGTDTEVGIGLPNNPYNRQAIVVEYLHLPLRAFRALRTSIRTGRWRTGPGTMNK